MGALFNVDEVFAIALQIEKNGAEFYRAMSSKQTDRSVKEYLNSLAAMEDNHVRIFADMRAAVAGSAGTSETTDLYNEGGLFLSAIAGGYPVEGSPSVLAALKGTETLAQILDIAVDLEKKSILFYLGMKDVVPATLGQDKIDLIIAEEKAHVVSLMDKLKQVRKN